MKAKPPPPPLFYPRTATVNCVISDDQLKIINTLARMHYYFIMVLVINCIFYNGFMTITLYIQAKENDAIMISRIAIENTLLYFAQKLCNYN